MATDALTRSELVDALVDKGVGSKRHVSHMLKALAEVAEEEVSEGHDFSVPGVVNIRYRYTAAQKKGERWKKGDTVVGFGGVEQVKEEDSPARKAKVVLKPSLVGAVSRAKPKSSPEAQAAFLKSKAGKAVVKRAS